MASYFSFPEKLKPEDPVEQSDLALCVISGQGELRCRDPPIFVDQTDGSVRMVIVTFVALLDEVWLYDMLSVMQLTRKMTLPAGLPTVYM